MTVYRIAWERRAGPWSRNRAECEAQMAIEQHRNPHRKYRLEMMPVGPGFKVKRRKAAPAARVPVQGEMFA